MNVAPPMRGRKTFTASPFPGGLKKERLWLPPLREINYLALTSPLVVIAVEAFWWIWSGCARGCNPPSAVEWQREFRSPAVLWEILHTPLPPSRFVIDLSILQRRSVPWGIVSKCPRFVSEDSCVIRYISYLKCYVLPAAYCLYTELLAVLPLPSFATWR
jgi:hypothetical protein